MKLSVIAQEGLLPQINDLGKRGGYHIGLIVGQFSSSKLYVVHFAETPLEKEKDSQPTSKASEIGDTAVSAQEGVAVLSDFQVSMLLAHGRAVTRVLPGGMWVLGLYVVGPTDVFADKNLNLVRQWIPQLQKSCMANSFLQGANPSKSLIVFSFASDAKKYSCKAFNVENILNISMHPADWKFHAHPFRWFQVDSELSLTSMDGVFVPKGKSDQALKTHLLNSVKFLSSVVEKSIGLVTDHFEKESITLDVLQQLREEKKKELDDEEDQVLEDDCFIVELFTDSRVLDPSSTVRLNEIGSRIVFGGVLKSRVFLHEKASVDEAVQWVKDDLVRSWAARVEMHLGTLESDQETCPTGMQILPRRILFTLPNSKVAFSEYLFPDEGIEEAALSLEENLGLQVDRESIDFSFEAPPNDTLPKGSESSPEGRKVMPETKRPRFLVVGIAAAAIALILSILAQFFLLEAGLD